MAIDAERSSSALQSAIRFDELSGIIAILILLSYLFHQQPSPITHPVILAHQAGFSRIRNRSETPIITNSTSTRGFLPVIPDRSTKSLLDLLLQSGGKLNLIDIQSIISSNLSLKDLVSITRNNLWSLLLTNSETTPEQAHPNLLILCNDPYLKLILSAAAATLPIRTILVTPNQSGLLSIDVRQTLGPYLNNISLIISESTKDTLEELLALDRSVTILSPSDIAHWFQPNHQLNALAPNQSTELANARLIAIHDPVKSKGAQQRDRVKVIEFTPENLLAGITASLSLPPLKAKLNSDDAVALEFLTENFIWGNEISFAIAALYAGADVYFFKSFKLLSECKPTILVIKELTANTLAESIIQLSKLSIFKKLAVARRLSRVSGGSLGSPLPETIKWVGPKLRGILTNGAISYSSANLIRAAFGVSFQRVYYHPVAAGPILAAQPYDFQLLRRLSDPLHCGPPCVNVECKIIDVPEPSLVINDAWKGKLVVRGPSTGNELRDDKKDNKSVTNSLKNKANDLQDFQLVAEIAQVLPNGTFHILPSSDLNDD